jgi:hypothetical protein
MKRKKPVRIDNFYPLVAYMKGYLRREKPGPDASKIRKDRYALAVRCVKKMDELLIKKNVVIGKTLWPPPPPGPGCGSPEWPLRVLTVIGLLKK